MRASRSKTSLFRKTAAPVLLELAIGGAISSSTKAVNADGGGDLAAP
jgi:hypothetical protein